jgi:hypothetical protein
VYDEQCRKLLHVYLLNAPKTPKTETDERLSMSTCYRNTEIIINSPTPKKDSLRKPTKSVFPLSRESWDIENLGFQYILASASLQLPIPLLPHILNISSIVLLAFLNISSLYLIHNPLSLKKPPNPHPSNTDSFS